MNYLFVLDENKENQVSKEAEKNVANYKSHELIYTVGLN